MGYCLERWTPIYPKLTHASCLSYMWMSILTEFSHLTDSWDSFYHLKVFFKLPEPLNSMLTIATKDKWKRIRNTLSPAFSALKMKQIVPLMNICCDNLIKKLGEFADKEESVDIKK